MKKSGYHFSKPAPLGNIVEAGPYGLNDSQKIIQRQGGEIKTPRISLGYVPSQLVKISRQCKEKYLLA